MNPEQIKALRQSLNLTQERFAHELGVTLGSVSSWERGKATPSPLAMEKLEALAKKMEGK